jgi:hypothetical protein
MNTNETMSEVRRAALDMGSLICQEADEIELQRRLTSRVVEAMKRAGVFRNGNAEDLGRLRARLT